MIGGTGSGADARVGAATDTGGVPTFGSRDRVNKKPTTTAVHTPAATIFCTFVIGRLPLASLTSVWGVRRVGLSERAIALERGWVTGRFANGASASAKAVTPGNRRSTSLFIARFTTATRPGGRPARQVPSGVGSALRISWMTCRNASPLNGVCALRSFVEHDAPRPDVSCARQRRCAPRACSGTCSASSRTSSPCSSGGCRRLGRNFAIPKSSTLIWSRAVANVGKEQVLGLEVAVDDARVVRDGRRRGRPAATMFGGAA